MIETICPQCFVKYLGSERRTLTWECEECYNMGEGDVLFCSSNCLDSHKLDHGAIDLV